MYRNLFLEYSLWQKSNCWFFGFTFHFYLSSVDYNTATGAIIKKYTDTMEIFITLLVKLLPLYIIVFLGFIAGKHLRVQKESVTSLLMYIVAPIVLFNGILTTKLTFSTLSIPVLFFMICLVVTGITYYVAGYIWKDATKNILAYISGTANTGYFGLPVSIVIFGNYVVGIVGLILLGTALFANSVGFFLAAKGNHTTKESIMRVLKLPLLYAFILAVFINLSGVFVPEIVYNTADYFVGAFTVLGMMLVGIAIADVSKGHIDLKFTGLSLIAKYIFWPVIILAVIYFDSRYLNVYSQELHAIFLLIAFVPVAANTASVATILKTHPEKAAIDVLVSTLFALVIIPLVAIYFLR